MVMSEGVRPAALPSVRPNQLPPPVAVAGGAPTGHTHRWEVQVTPPHSCFNPVGFCLGAWRERRGAARCVYV